MLPLGALLSHSIGPTPAGPVADEAAALLDAARESCRAHGRDDLDDRLRVAGDRLSGPSTVVAVIGEFKQGKSQLVNALVGHDVCPVDDDVATSAITVCYHAPTASARVRRGDGGEVVVETIDPAGIRQYVTEQGNPGNRLGVEMVEVGVPSPLLAEGLTLIDTPGTGGLIREYTATTLRFLTVSDALLFVTDASAELSDAERAFLERAQNVCPTVLVALTKVDLYPEWRRIAELDRGHLARLGVETDLIAVSSTLGRRAAANADPALAAESGVEDLADIVRARILAGAKERSAARALEEVEGTLDVLTTPLRTEIEVIEDPDRVRRTVDDLRAAEARLVSLREGGARWSTVLNDGFADLRSDVDFRLRTMAKDVAWEFEQRLEDIDPGVEWSVLGGELQTRMGDEAAALFEHVDAGAGEIRDRVADALRGAELGPSELPRSAGLDVEALWSASDRTVSSEAPGVLSLGLTALRGGSSGVILLGMIARFASIAAMNPVALGVGAAFGAKQVIDVRKRSVQQRRQEARTLQRQFLDQVQLELGNRVHQVLQLAQRSLRDHYVAQIQEAAQTCTTSIASLQQAMHHDQETAPKRLHDLRGELARLEDLAERASRLAAGIGGAE